LSWWELGEHSGFQHGLPRYQIACAFCGVKNNFDTVQHIARKKPGDADKELNYDTVKCGECGNGNLPTGLVYEVDCRDRGNGPTTTIAIGAGTDRKDATKSTSAPETVRQVVLITDCSFDVGSNARIDATLAISTRITSSSGLNASSGAIVGDPLKNCDVSRKVYIMTMSSVNVSADFTASNVALMVNGDIHVAASSSSSEVEHKGTSFHAEGEVQIPANHTFNGCLEDYSGLIPGVRTLRFVMPRA
jgi:hypothetical protein